MEFTASVIELWTRLWPATFSARYCGYGFLGFFLLPRRVVLYGFYFRVRSGQSLGGVHFWIFLGFCVYFPSWLRVLCRVVRLFFLWFREIDL